MRIRYSYVFIYVRVFYISRIFDDCRSPDVIRLYRCNYKVSMTLDIYITRLTRTDSDRCQGVYERSFDFDLFLKSLG